MADTFATQQAPRPDTPGTGAPAPARPPHRVDWGTLRKDAWHADWEVTNRRAALLCLPVIAAWVVLGLVEQTHEEAVRGIAGAVAVGFGAFQNFGKRLRWMSVTLVGIVAATWIGAVAGYAGWGWLVVAVAAGGYLFGALSRLGQGTFWVGLQWMIALLVYGAHPAGPHEAFTNAGFVAAGGLSQLFFMSLLLPLTNHWFRRPAPLPLDVDGLSVRAALLRNLKPTTPAGCYAMRIAAALAVAEVVYHVWGLPHGYWAPMTAAVLIRPDAHDSTVRALCRSIGTVTGAGLATLIVALRRPERPELAVMLLVMIWACYALQRVNYGIFSACITAYIVLLLSLLGLPGLEVAKERVVATLIGAGIALAIHLPVIRGCAGCVAELEAPLPP